MKKIIPATILLFIKIYATVLTIFTIFRILLLITELNRIGDSSIWELARALLMGLRFDIVISSYIISIPFVILSIFEILNKKFKLINNSIRFLLITSFILTFIVSAADIPYFNHFFMRFTTTAFQWIDSPSFVFKMIIQEPRYWLIIIPLIILFYAFIRLNNKYFKDYTANQAKVKLHILLITTIFSLGLIFIGIRGRIEMKSPIRIGTAYFSNNPFLNQLGLNPNFTLMRSYLDAKKEENRNIELMDNELAIKNVQRYLSIQNPNSEFPILRKVEFDSEMQKDYNVVLIIMESMSAAKMSRHGNTDNLTPFLDSISKHSYYFENAYTSGIHTMNGIFSTLFSFPALFRQHPMKEASMLKYNGIYPTLRSNGYSTIYFTTHDGQFDNVEGFLKANDCERVVSKSDYPKNMIKTTLGVPDDYMFEFSIPILNELHEKGAPFFASFLTASDHGPYYLPEYFTPKNKEIKKQIVEYADFSLQKFINLASKQKWFDNTLFVFVADHGAPLDNLYSMSLNYHHTPLIFYSPKNIKEPKVFEKIAGQIDVFPTIMNLLKIPYYNNTLGIDLFKEEREYIYFYASGKYGVLNDTWFLIIDSEKNKSLFDYKNKNLNNFATEYPEIVEEMDNYAKSKYQTFQFLKNNNKQYYKNILEQ